MYKQYLNKIDSATHIRVGVGLIIYKGEKLLFEKRVDCNNWGLIGGGVEVGENIEKAAIRECIEETSINLKKENLKYLGIYSDISQFRIIKYPDNCFHAIDVIFSYELNTEVYLKKSKESLDLKFFNFNSLPFNIVPPAINPINDFIRLNL